MELWHQHDRGEIWHPLSAAEYREHLNLTLDDIDEELEEIESESRS